MYLTELLGKAIALPINIVIEVVETVVDEVKSN